MIFCVEDEANIRELVVYTLETTGFAARGFEEGTSFFEALAEELDVYKRQVWEDVRSSTVLSLHMQERKIQESSAR